MAMPTENTRTDGPPIERASRWILAAAVTMAIASMAMPATAETAPQDEVIGYVKTAVPDAEVVAAMNTSNTATTVKAVPGTPVRRGNSLRTGPAGSMGVTFKDNTIISIGPDTEVSVDDYLYEPSKGDLKLGASIGKGTMQYVSGVIAKLKPEAVAIKTPTGTIGVRGTKFVVKVEPTP
ncbi:MAG: hypothetical protein JWQ11_3176 [Rhizobacter sp.]|nr:hypothetical protein [Rhizobacter sp.]